MKYLHKDGDTLYLLVDLDSRDAIITIGISEGSFLTGGRLFATGLTSVSVKIRSEDALHGAERRIYLLRSRKDLL